MTNESRRGFLTASAATALAGVLPPGLRQALAARPAGSSLSDVRHVVVFVQENRSFDHYFGTLRGVRGYGDRAALRLPDGRSVFQQAGAGAGLFPFRMDTTKTSAQCARDLDYSWTGAHLAVNGGRNDGWVAAKGALSMGGYARADLPFHFALADAFTVCDQYFCSMQGPTNPNRLYLWTGTIDPRGAAGGPVIDNSALGYAWTTYPERLQAAGVSWKVYQDARDNFDDNPLAWFHAYQRARPGEPLHDLGMRSVPRVTGDAVQDIAAAIRADVLGGTLPQVSWIVAPERASEHPGGSPAAGADMINQVLEGLTADPQAWAATVMFLTYDENDGFFDHAVPPLPPPGTADEFVLGLPIGLGPRVPMIVVSPWSRGGHVCSQVFDHTSVLRFLEAWTGVRETNLSAWRRQVCGDLTAALDFASSSVAVPPMPDTAALARQAASECATLPPPEPPAQSFLPAQEPGTRPARALPWQPNANARVDKDAGRLWITMTNAGTQAVHFAVHANDYRVDGPWQYDVAPGATLEDHWSARVSGDGRYDLSLHGPNGFVRRFVGNLHTGGAKLEVEASYDLSTPGDARLVLALSNASRRAAVFTVRSNAYRADGPWLVPAPAGATVDLGWAAQADTGGWYDFTVTTDADKLFLRRIAGHVELGVPSVSG